jgi:Domain of unknown function (DUF4407)
MRSFLLRLAGERPENFDRFPSERIKFVSLGWAVLITGAITLTAVWTALTTALGLNPLLALPITICSGAGSAVLHRWMIRWIPVSGANRWIRVIPFLLLSLLIGSTLSTPITLRIFAAEINLQLAVIKTEREAAYLSSSAYKAASAQVTQWTSVVSNLDEVVASKGGTPSSPVSVRQTRLREAEAQLPGAREELTAATSHLDALQDSFENTNSSDGLLVQLQALDQLSAGSSTLQAARLLLFLLFCTIELLPLTVKLLQRPGNYEEIYKTAFGVEADSTTEPGSERYVPSGTLGLKPDRVPGGALRFLIPTERQVIAVSPHVAARIVPGAMSVVVGMAVGVGIAAFPFGWPGIFVPLAAASPGVYWGTRRIRAAKNAALVVSPLRILLVNWPRIGEFQAFSLADAEDMSFVQTLPGRVLGYGALRIRKPQARRRPFVIRYVPFPQQLYLEIAALIYRDVDKVTDRG